MNCERRFLSLEQVCKRIYSGGTPSTAQPMYWNGSLNWLSSGETRNSFIFDTEKKITGAGVKNSSTRLAHMGSTVVASAGQGYTRGQTSFLMIETYINQSVIVFEPNETIIEPLYLFYNLKNRYEEFRQLSDGTSTRGGLAGWIVKKMMIDVPTIDEQKRIVNILYSIDRAILINQQINDNLQQQAQALYKSWFVDFEPFGGTMPPNWKETALGKVCSCELGGTPSRAKPEYWNGDIPWINSGEVNLFRITKPSETITALGLQKSATKLLPSKTTVLAITGATLGQVSLLEIDSCANQSVVGIIPNEHLPYEYIYPFIQQNIKEIISHQTGGAQQHINKQNVEGLAITIPDTSILEQYRNLTSGLYEMIANNCFENERLIAIRDSLLPKLMSGEIDVSDVQV